MRHSDVEYVSDDEYNYECLRCGTTLRADSYPGSCPDCGTAMRNRRMPYE
ncbi:rubrerythrin-like domain-containing protein [Halorussus amylolyticus]|nr:rubrerythrin-like domain-containing protein [Halorussus amylolyticus]